MQIGLLFSGQGDQTVGMGKSLYLNTNLGKILFQKANEVLGFDLMKVMFEGPETQLTESNFCQPALYVHGYIVAALLQEANQLSECRLVGGLSLGELTALAVAEVFSFEEGLQIVKERARLMHLVCEQTSGAMLCLLGSDALALAQQLAQECDIDVANINSPEQVVLSGEKERILKAKEQAASLPIKRAILLNVAGASHSRCMEPAAQQFASFLKQFSFKTPKFPVLSNVLGQLVTNAEDFYTLLPQQITSSVQWVRCIQEAIKAGVSEFYECGPKTTLNGLNRKIDSQLSTLSLGEWEALVPLLQKERAL